MTLIVRTKGDRASVAAPVRTVVRGLGPAIPIGEIRTMEDVVARALSRERFTLALIGAFAGVALLLAAVGVYGVIARMVAMRTREIGLRMAVGADRTTIARSVLREGVLLAGIGGVRGLLAGVTAR
ncbi:MAG: FtsX-like permease family protein [Longimicrobiales bacterium]